MSSNSRNLKLYCLRCNSGQYAPIGVCWHCGYGRFEVRPDNGGGIAIIPSEDLPGVAERIRPESALLPRSAYQLNMPEVVTAEENEPGLPKQNQGLPFEIKIPSWRRSGFAKSKSDGDENNTRTTSIARPRLSTLALLWKAILVRLEAWAAEDDTAADPASPAAKGKKSKKANRKTITLSHTQGSMCISCKKVFTYDPTSLCRRCR